MKLADIKKALETISGTPSIAGCKAGNMTLIVNESENVGYDVKFMFPSSLEIKKFKREPYKTFDIMTGYERLTLKQGQFVRGELIRKFFPDLEYML